MLVEKGFSSFKSSELGIFFNLSRNFTKTVDLGWQISPFPVQIPIGLNIKVIHKELYDIKADGIGFDLGTMAAFGLDDMVGNDWLGDLILGLSITDIVGTPVYWSSGKYDKISMSVISGLGYRQTFNNWPVEILLLRQQESGENNARSGIEILWKKLIAVRFGNDLGEIQGGIGLALSALGKNISIDYSFAAHSLGDAHRFGGSIIF